MFPCARTFLARPLAILTPLTMLGCLSTPPPNLPELAPTKDQFSTTVNATPEATVQLDPKGRWWEQLEQAELNTLLDTAFQQNPRVLQLRARTNQALARAGVASAALWPDLGLTFRGGRSKTFSERLGQTLSTINNQFSLTLQANYSIDLFGEDRNTVGAATLNTLATVDDLRQGLLDTASDVVKSWFSLIEATEQLRLVQRNLKADQKNLEMVQTRLRLGLASAFDVNQAQIRVNETRAEVPNLRKQLALAHQRLAMLLGRYPNSEPQMIIPTLPDIIPNIQATVPSELLKTRPDVRAAMLRIRAANHDVAAGVAARFPRLSISASLSKQSDEWQEVFSPKDIAWNLVGNLTAPLFDAGRRAAEVERRRAVLDELLIAYESTTRAAFQSVEAALRGILHGGERVELVRTNVDLAEKGLSLVMTSYLQGIASWSEVLAAQKSRYQIERSLISSRVALWTDIVSLTSALGGSWPNDIVTDDPKGDHS